MLYNPNMYGTGRIAIKFIDGEKCVISKCYVQDRDALSFTCSDAFMPVIEFKNREGEIQQIDVCNENTFIFCEGIKILSNKITMDLIIQPNVCVEEDYEGEYDFINYYLSINEPEEPINSITYTLNMKGIKSVDADLELFVLLLNEGIITGREKSLLKYDLLPEMRLYMGGKDKTKVKSANGKIKYIR